ncbi:hypothetical protein HMPREF9371_0204 [Neisseria shayeganii 871]|uniref:Uncharacterized protein n=1 Tax=Neisseria shayeganii 871 TaxID=1032488 RepID=G4CF15_9NEIS|nr:hypothetical protein HMPREF9371_0204 [Neisseria shayeganii 871]
MVQTKASGYLKAAGSMGLWIGPRQAEVDRECRIWAEISYIID